MNNTRQWVEAVLYGTGNVRRFTQDSPVLPDVWLAYLEQPDAAVDLLIEPWLETAPAGVAKALSQSLAGDGASSETRVTSNRTTVIATLTLKQVIENLLPITGWYQTELNEVETATGARLSGLERASGRATGARRSPAKAVAKESFDRRLPRARELWEDIIRPAKRSYPHPKVLSLIRIAGLIVYIGLHGRKAIEGLIIKLAAVSDDDAAEARQELARRMLSGFRHTFGVELPEMGKQKLAYAINRNRQATMALTTSLRTIKADAATSLFTIRCNRLTWAVVDCGIDARHPAFLDWSDPKKGLSALDSREPDAWIDATRVRATYDFSYLREILLGEIADRDLPEHVKRLARRKKGESAEDFEERKEKQAETIRLVRVGRSIDWEALRPFIEVPHTEEGYVSPADGHGTHVAGIVGADWRKRREGSPTELEVVLTGVCRDIRLIDVRVCKRDGSSDEFVIMSALQFLRHLNANSDFPSVNGANMSLSLIHDAANYACGQTPICKEAERTVASGVTVVAAAGNLGFRWLLGENSHPFQQYFLASITDPGNADSVITVGSTHRMEPHTYGVSYFSSRGPTGDGRMKPDLVAPGEKIFAPTLENAAIRLDGTSMAAPHVSGAAALLMARHVELMQQPAKIKQILCKTATDLGRERYFQGHGLVDILRAIQSV